RRPPSRDPALRRGHLRRPNASALPRPGGDGMTSVGVTMSVYNGAATVTQALASVAGQTRRPDQVVVVDDGSSDGTVAAAEAWDDVLPLRVLRHARNSGVA